MDFLLLHQQTVATGYCCNFILLQLVTVVRHFVVGDVGVVIGGYDGVVFVNGVGVVYSAADFASVGVSGFVVSGIVIGFVGVVGV